MRIIITINTSWNIYNFRSGLIKALIGEGHEVTAVAPEDSFSQKLVELGCKYVPIKMENTGVNPLSDIKLFLNLRKIYKIIDPHIVLQYTVKPNIYGSLAARSLRIPVINNVSGLGTVFLSKTFSSLIAKWLYKIAFQKVDLVFFQNADDKNDFILEISLPLLSYDLLPGSGINLRKYIPSPKLETEKFIFLMIARVIIDKGIFEFAGAAEKVRQKHPEVEFHLLGQLDEHHRRGISREMVNQWESEGTIKYLGESEDVRINIASADCIVLPSYREGTPRTLLEAGAMSKPIITTDVPGCREVVVDGENGFFCLVNDENDLADKMFDMIKLSPEELKLMGQKGRKHIEEHFDEQIVIKKYIKHISNIMNQNTM